MSKHLHKPLKIILLIFTCLISFVVILFLITLFGFSYISKKTNQTPLNLTLNIFNAWHQNSFENNSRLNFIILGLDKRDDSLEKTITTDTIIFSSLDFNSQNLSLISLPRDIWDYQLNTKINGIYPMAVENNDIFPFVQKSYSDLTGQSIDKTIIITTDSLIDFVNTIGGVDVNLKVGFTDTQYPNPEYIKNPIPSVPKYKTIQFSSGLVHLDQSNITEFVRSRKGGETAATGGTDIGRIERQQLLIDAIIKKVKTKEFISNYSNIIKLYNFWHQDITTNLSDKDIFSLIFILKQKLNNITLNKIVIPIGTTDKNGIIYHPEKFINKQWVFTTSDQNYSKLKQFISQSIDTKN